MLYKIWSLKEEKYIPGQDSKTTWTSLKWIATKLKKIKDDSEYYTRRSNTSRFNIADYEIHKCELVHIETLSASDALFGLETKIENEDILKANIKGYKRQIIDIVNKKMSPTEHGFDIWTIKKIYGRNILHHEIEEAISDLMEKLKLAERTFNK